jgi:hypothetical protein
MKTIKFKSKELQSRLRNGLVKTTGVDLCADKDVVRMQAISSKGLVASGWIEIERDYETLNQLAKAFKELADEVAVSSDLEPDECYHCNSRNINRLDCDDYECYDCGRIFSSASVPSKEASTECVQAPTECVYTGEERVLCERFRAIAKNHQKDGDIEFDQEMKVSLSENPDEKSGYGGAYVQAWYYIPYSEIDND